ncbi:hypothetical protein [Aeromicrobium ginsengisoli]|uniref:Uncharacterized protein n=1 Tax=Aeromicrobium ginsengisoli TaxID=363867 RepID=A0A5M4FFZ1_9ACTN|nr:hypothetical protein [Aeromicrobium ginsengisoli]KAA1397781.1 hypothetical protein ESP70_010570 [Aeromicrobium ginsengisoli]
MSTFEEELQAATDTRIPADFISGVKRVVQQRLTSLDPTLRLEDTQYFNHSAIPDFVATWPGEKDSRPIYLRDSYEAVRASQDATVLAAKEPVVLALHVQGTRPDLQTNSNEGRAGQVLVTDSAAVDVVRADPDADSPLGELVRANFIRGGRGLIDEPRASSLVQLERVPDGGQPRDNERTTALIGDSFSSDAATRIVRTAQLIALAGTPDLNADQIAQTSELVQGRLSLAELKHLLPWLLQQRRGASETFWRHVGSMMRFEDLESIRSELRELDLTPVIVANAAHWTAKRAYIGVSLPIAGGEDLEARREYWSFVDGALGIDFGEQRLSIAHLGTMLKPRKGTASIPWSRLSPALSGFQIAAVELKGIRRSVTVTAEQSDDIAEDVRDVTESLDDHYSVTRVDLRFAKPDQDGTTDAEVQFENELVVGDHGVAIRDTVRTALSVLNLGAVPDNDLPETLRATL